MAKEFMYSSVFKELTRIVSLRLDEVSRQNKALFDNVIFERYFDWDTPSIPLEFEELIGRYNITTAAATIGDNSKEPVLGTYGAQTLAQKVLHHAIARSMSAQDYRKVMALTDSTRLSDQARKEELIRLMWGEVSSVVDGVLARLDIIVLNALSNEGVAVIDAENNPEGGVRATIDYGMPAENKLKVGTAWISDNKSTVDPIEDIESVVDAADGKVVFDKILMSLSQASFVRRSAAVRKAIWGSDRSSSNVTLAMLNDYLSSNDLPTIEIIRRQVQVSNNGQLSTLTPWNANYAAFIPAGTLGVIKNAWADNELEPEDGVAYSNYNRVRVSQWRVGESLNSNIAEFTKAQVYALPVFTEINGIYSLNTNPAD